MGRTGVEEQGASPPFAGDLGYASSVFKQFPDSSVGKESACNAGDPGLIPGLGRSPEEEKGYPLQYSGLENSMDCTVLGVKKSQTQLSDFHSQKSHQCHSTICRIL